MSDHCPVENCKDLARTEQCVRDMKNKCDDRRKDIYEKIDKKISAGMFKLLITVLLVVLAGICATQVSALISIARIEQNVVTNTKNIEDISRKLDTVKLIKTP